MAKEAKATGKSARSEAREARRIVSGVKKTQFPGTGNSAAIAASNRAKRMQRVLSTKGQAASIREGTAEYMHSLLIPEEGPARIPDLLSYPTAVLHFRQTYTPVAVAQASTGLYFTAIVFCPQITGGVQTVTGIDATGTFTYSQSDLPFAQTVRQNFSAFRCVSMALRVHNATNINGKMGVCYLDMCGGAVNNTGAGAGTMASPKGLYDVLASPSATYGSFSQDYLEDIPRIAWLPGRIANQEFIATAIDNDIIQAKVPSLVVCIDHATVSSAAVQNTIIEVFYNFELVPLYSTMSLFPLDTSVGDPAQFAHEFLANAGKIYEVVRSTVSGAEKTLGAIVNSNLVTSAMGGLAAMGTPTTAPFGELLPKLRALLQNTAQDKSAVEAVRAAAPSDTDFQALLDALVRISERGAMHVEEKVSGVWGKDRAYSITFPGIEHGAAPGLRHMPPTPGAGAPSPVVMLDIPETRSEGRAGPIPFPPLSAAAGSVSAVPKVVRK